MDGHELRGAFQPRPDALERAHEADEVLSRIQATDGQDVAVADSETPAKRCQDCAVPHGPEAGVGRVGNDRDTVGRNLVGGLDVAPRELRPGNDRGGTPRVGRHEPAQAPSLTP